MHPRSFCWNAPIYNLKIRCSPRFKLDHALFTILFKCAWAQVLPKCGHHILSRLTYMRPGSDRTRRPLLLVPKCALSQALLPKCAHKSLYKSHMHLKLDNAPFTLYWMSPGSCIEMRSDLLHNTKCPGSLGAEMRPYIYFYINQSKCTQAQIVLCACYYALLNAPGRFYRNAPIYF